MFEMNEALFVLLFWNDILVESSCSLKFSNRLGKVNIFELPLPEFCCLVFFNLIMHVVRTIWCLHNISMLDLRICRNCNTSYIFGQYFKYFIFWVIFFSEVLHFISTVRLFYIFYSLGNVKGFQQHRVFHCNHICF